MPRHPSHSHLTLAGKADLMVSLFQVFFEAQT